MKYKASLHIHTKEDFVDGKIISHTIYDLIDKAAAKDFKVLALTGHKTFLFKDEYAEFAIKKGVLLISGIELSLSENFLRHSHILVLNCQKSAENISTFEELREYKDSNPEIFIIVPHPFFDMTNSISKNKLIEFMDIFDAIEHSWFYSRFFNLNRRVELIAENYNKPYISTADIHFLDFMDSDYVILDCDELNVESAFEVIRKFRFENKTSPKNFFRLVGVFLKMIYLNLRSII